MEKNNEKMSIRFQQKLEISVGYQERGYSHWKAADACLDEVGEKMWKAGESCGILYTGSVRMDRNLLVGENF